MTNITIPKAVVEQAAIFVNEAREHGYHFDCVSPTRLFTKLSAAISAAAEPVKPKCGRECDRICQQPSGYGDCRKLSSPAPAVPDAAKPETQGERPFTVAVIAAMFGVKMLPMLQRLKAVGHDVTANQPLTKEQAAALLAAPMHVEPLTVGQRFEIVSKWRGRNWTVGDIIDAVEAALLSAGPARVEPLTEEQIADLFGGDYHYTDMARAVERAHGIGKDQAS